jgi:hypothetical protein
LPPSIAANLDSLNVIGGERFRPGKARREILDFGPAGRSMARERRSLVEDRAVLLGGLNRRQLPVAGIFTRGRPWRLIGRRVVAKQFLQPRFLIKPCIVRHFRFRFGQREPRRLRFVCPRDIGAFFRRRLTPNDVSRRTMP